MIIKVKEFVYDVEVREPHVNHKGKKTPYVALLKYDPLGLVLATGATRQAALNGAVEALNKKHENTE